MKTKTKNTCSCKDSLAIKNSPKKILQRSTNAFKLAMPVVGYALIPKCPVCLAGYIALGTGVGLSITTATYLRTALIIICMLSIVYFLAKHARRFIEVHKTQKRKMASIQ
jgi:predicted transporter